MSEIIFTCECGKVYKFNKRFSGRSSRCIICKRDYVVPLVSEQIRQTVPAGVISDDGEIPFLSPVFSSLFPSSEDENASGDEFHPAAMPPALTDFDNVPKLSAEAQKLSAGTQNLTAESQNLTARFTPRSDQIQDGVNAVVNSLGGKYEIREKIGSGGMGTVFYAWDTQLQRKITIKTLNKKNRHNKSYKERFINEARITGKLVHSGIIPIYSLDYDNQGEPYYVMRFLEGQTFEQLITQYHNLKGALHTPEELRHLIRHFIHVCQTITYAHDHHVVHRDIKPSNIMLSGYGETIILDWGLAKVLTPEPKEDADSDSLNEFNNELNNDLSNDIAGNLETDERTFDLTLSGGRVGTLGFQSPEYLRDGVSRISDDIYALGITLYFLLNNKLPYKVSRDHRGIFDLLMTPPRPPHWDNAHVSRPLSAICLCALAFDKTKRYSSASHLAADLQCWLDGNPVSVYRMSWQEKIEAWIQKNVVLLGACAVAFVMGIVLTRLLTG
ncbi:MAG: serine/threonine protein kinase [Planctomycetaceae bacterium]|jgi:serine/threonine protein kinase|nr:serine/threonine protein kinase [Planctomycetaceae bacterium]